MNKKDKESRSQPAGKRQDDDTTVDEAGVLERFDESQDTVSEKTRKSAQKQDTNHIPPHDGKRAPSVNRKKTDDDFVDSFLSNPALMERAFGASERTLRRKKPVSYSVRRETKTTLERRCSESGLQLHDVFSWSKTQQEATPLAEDPPNVASSPSSVAGPPTFRQEDDMPSTQPHRTSISCKEGTQAKQPHHRRKVKKRSHRQLHQSSSALHDGHAETPAPETRTTSARSLSADLIQQDDDPALPPPNQDTTADEEPIDWPVDIGEDVVGAPLSNTTPEEGTDNMVQEEGTNSDPLSDTEEDLEANNDATIQEDAFSAYLAPDPEEARRRILEDAISAIDVRPYPTAPPQSQNKWRTPLILLVIVAIAAGVAISLGVTLSRRNNSGECSTNTSMSPTQSPTTSRFGQVVSLVESLFNTTMQDPLSPQYQAALWMSDVDTVFDDFAGIDPNRFSQRYALVLFYFATGGPDSWIERSFFLQNDTHECEWRETPPWNVQSWNGFVGVFNCSTDMWVEGIEINKNNLTGTLPKELGALSSLTKFILFGNSIGGTLPPTLFDLPNLQDLVIFNNKVTGTIPADVGRASSLRFLVFRQNSLVGTLPTELGLILGLNVLDVSTNSLTGSIPETLLKISTLGLLDFGWNSFAGTLPSSLWTSWPILEQFGVLNNRLSGTIPDSLDSLPNLDRIELGGNDFTGPFPSSIVALTKVVSFSVAENALTGSLPNNWSNLSSTLERLRVHNNDLTGTLPESLGTLKLLNTLMLANNEFNGTLPENMGNLTMLQDFQVQGNHLTGTIPKSFAQLTALRQLALHGNELKGDLNFLCVGKENIFSYLFNFAADCVEEVSCSCCNHCCNVFDTCGDV